MNPHNNTDVTSIWLSVRDDIFRRESADFNDKLKEIFNKYMSDLYYIKYKIIEKIVPIIGSNPVLVDNNETEDIKNIEDVENIEDIPAYIIYKIKKCMTPGIIIL